MKKNFEDLGKQLDEMFTGFDGLFDWGKLDNAEGRSILNHNGHIILRGKFKSITVNSEKLRVSDEVLRG